MLPMALLSWFRMQPGHHAGPGAALPLPGHGTRAAAGAAVIRPIGGLDISFIVVFLVLQYVVVRVLFS
jgi:hypothetical protein